MQTDTIEPVQPEKCPKSLKISFPKKMTCVTLASLSYSPSFHYDGTEWTAHARRGFSFRKKTGLVGHEKFKNVFHKFCMKIFSYQNRILDWDKNR